ncbi:MAG: tetratricopeptide repeat protein [Candidatus Eisenbacteria bacterium]|nr:tetratricopeptide repeat protein [Candidatus Eisenbacteria bacterium]
MKTKATGQAGKSDIPIKKRGRGRREIVLVSTLAVLVILIIVIVASSRAEETTPPAPQATGQTQEAQPPTPEGSSVTPQTAEQSQTTGQAAQGTTSPGVMKLPVPPTVKQKVDELSAKVAGDSLNYRLHYELANALHDAELRDEAIAEYDKALAIEPSFVEALVNKGAVLNELGRISEAISSFQKVLAVRPRDTRALCNLGNSFYALKDYDKAMKQYKLAVEADSTFAEGYYYIGIAFADAGMYREAVREWEKILAVAPGTEAARNAQDNINALKTFMAGQ